MASNFDSRIPAVIRALPQAFDSGMSEASHAIAEIADANAPSDEPGGRGPLKESIRVEKTHEGARTLWWVVAGGGKAFYAHFVEFGTVHTAVTRQHQAGWARTFAREHPERVWTVPAHPFMTPAAEQGRPLAQQRAHRQIEQACNAGHL